MILGVAALESGWLYLVSCAVLFALANALFPHAGYSWSGSLPPVVSCAIAYYYTDLYDHRVIGNFREYRSRLPKALLLALLLLVAYYLVVPKVRVFPGLLPSVLVGFVLLLAFSLPLRWIASAALRSYWIASERVLIVGTSPLARRVADALRASHRHRLVGSLDDNQVSGTLPLFPLATSLEPRLGSLDSLSRTVADLRPDRIIVGLTERRSRMPVGELLEYRARGIVIEDAREAYERITQKLAIETLSPSSLVFGEVLRRSKVFTSFQRAISFLAAAVGFIVTAPLMAVIALLIKIDSKGPIFFLQRRAGLFGQPFRLIKFRTMEVEASEEQATSFWAADNGDRITRVGWWLRRLRLDELPQFWNILRGDMNLIGPRPHPIANAALFRDLIPYYPLRELVPPGLTGWAQIRNGYANGLAEETEKMRYDLYYIKNRSLWLDARILLDTVKIVLTADGT